MSRSELSIQMEQLVTAYYKSGVSRAEFARVNSITEAIKLQFLRRCLLRKSADASTELPCVLEELSKKLS